MLELKEITKKYVVAGGSVNALNGVSIKFRKNEFVSILGPSGCGKTTLLNIIGGLDKYTSGDLVIEGVSTKKYSDGDWDTYRNHSIGFIFQSYHLIPHQTILENVELALTISGVSREERKKRAVAALEAVGLGDKIKNRPNQLSGGQAQRVAIARALINDPEIVLADEPTGALDSVTSVQIMELLKEISKDRLVIMVTHNPELAEQYSTRIIRLLDGNVQGDTMPYGGEEAEQSPAAEEEKPSAEAPLREEPVSEAQTQEEPLSEAPLPENAAAGSKKKNKGKKKHSSMSFGMSFMLSLKNLLSKGKRTAMVSVAGSIGIVGVSMVLAISSGVQGYIKHMQNDLLSGYPLSVTETAIDFASLMDFANTTAVKADVLRLDDKVYVDSLLETLMGFSGAMSTNNITQDYKDFVEAMPSSYYNALQFSYDFDLSNYIFTDFTVDGTAEKTQNVSVTAIRAKYTSILEKQESYKNYAQLISTVDSFSEIPDNYEYILSQYDILATESGKTQKLTEEELKDIFEDKNSLIMVVSDNGFSDLNFGQFGYMSEDEFLNFAYRAENEEGGAYDQEVIDRYEQGVSFDKFVGENSHKFTWYPNDTVYVEPTASEKIVLDMVGNQMGGVKTSYKYVSNSEDFPQDGKIDMRVKVILQKKESISYGCLSSGLYYTRALTEHTLQTGLESKISKYIAENGNLDWLPYVYDYDYVVEAGGEYQTAQNIGYIYNARKMMTVGMGGIGGGGDQIEALKDMLKVTSGVVAGSDLPVAFFIYPLSFDSKDLVTQYLDLWNEACTKTAEGGTLEFTDINGELRTVHLTEADKITYTDTVGLIIAMVNTMIQVITVSLIAFTALSLIVSTVMVGIITYVSVVERIKEIGILRAVGARKRDVGRLFNAETFIIGLVSGIFGITVTYLVSLVINLIIGGLFGIYTIASLPIWQAAVMVGVSVVLTLISGLIPASAAANKDPVVALRTE